MKKRVLSVVMLMLLLFTSVGTTIVNAREIVNLNQKTVSFAMSMSAQGSTISQYYFNPNQYPEGCEMSCGIYNNERATLYVQLIDHTDGNEFVDSFMVYEDNNCKYNQFTGLEANHVYYVEVYNMSTFDSDINVRVY